MSTSTRARSVVHVMGWESQQYGSFERFLVQLSAAVAEADAAFHAVFPTPPPSAEFVADLAAEIHVLPSASRLPDPRFALGLARLLDATGATHLHVHHGLDGYHALALPRRGRRRYLTKHNTPTPSRRRSLQHRWMAGAVDRMFAVSTMVGDRLVELGVPAAKVDVCHLGVDIERYSPDPGRRSKVRGDLGLGPEDRLVLATSHLRPWKGVEALPELASALADEPDRVLVAAAGSGPLESDLRSDAAARGLSSERFRLLGLRDDVPDLLAAADLFVFPTTSGIEGFPLGVLEAIATGIPVVAADVVSDFRSVFGDVVVRYPPADRRALVDRCRRILGDPVDAAARVARGRRIVRDDLATRRAVATYVEAYGL